MRCYNTGLIFNLEHMLKLQMRHSAVSTCWQKASTALSRNTSMMMIQSVQMNRCCLEMICSDVDFIFWVKYDYKCCICFVFKQAAMQTYENKGADVYTSVNSGHMNGTELTRMKEVAFEKSPSEPMVYWLFFPHAQTHILRFMLPIPPHRRCRLPFRGSLWSWTTNRGAPWPGYCTGAWSTDKVINHVLKLGKLGGSVPNRFILERKFCTQRSVIFQ